MPTEKAKKKPTQRRKIDEGALQEIHSAFGAPPWDPDDYDSLPEVQQEETVFASIHPINKSLKKKNTNPINRLNLPYNIKILLYKIAVVGGLDVILELLAEHGNEIDEKKIQMFLRKKYPKIYKIIVGLSKEELRQIITKALEDLEKGKEWTTVFEKLPQRIKKKIKPLIDILGDTFTANHLKRLLQNELKKL